jgi:hypothetical protein
VRECSERMAALEEQVRRMESREKSSARESSERVAALEEQVQSLESREKRSARESSVRVAAPEESRKKRSTHKEQRRVSSESQSDESSGQQESTNWRERCPALPAWHSGTAERVRGSPASATDVESGDTTGSPLPARGARYVKWRALVQGRV